MQKPVEILKVKIDPLTWKEVRDRLKFLVGKKGKSQIATINSEFIVEAQHNPDFMDCLNGSQLRVADGSGVLIAAQFLNKAISQKMVIRQVQGFFRLFYYVLLSFIYPAAITKPIPERIAGVDLSRELIKLAIEHDLRVFLLGGGVGVADKAALKLQTDYYGLKIAGIYSGSPRIEEEKKIVELINKHKTDIIFVAFGAPKQDLWLARNLRKTTAKLGVGVGGTLDVFAGDIKRAPLWMQSHGLEWLFRFSRQPFTRYKRMLQLPKFLGMVYRAKVKTNKPLTDKAQ
jgi:N-acetylglucosaminyldiphosphoundecaprenol N-acetyl-beta-D-mannosaminyltransferase